MRRVAIWVVLALVVLAAGVVRAEETKDAPIPMLDTGGHMTKINDISFTPDGQQLVSASNDKTIRVWDVTTGKTIRTIRGEAAPGDAGTIYAMALSPDGKWLAAGGWTKIPGQNGYLIRLYDFASGRLVALLNEHKDAILGLAFSSDGRHLISGGADKTAIIWDVETKRLKHRLRGHKDQIYAVGFTPDGQRAVTGSLDHDLRLWGVPDGAEITRMPGHGDYVFCLAVAPDGTIASGDHSGEIRLWNGNTGALRRVLARQNRGVGSLSFSPDGKRLLSSASGGIGLRNNHVYDLASGQETVTYRGHDNIVLATAISPGGRWAATGGGDNNEIHIWDLKTGKRRKGPDGQPLTLGGRGRPVFAVGFSPDGRRIGWGNTYGYKAHNERGPLEYALTLPLGDAPLSGPVAIDEKAPPHLGANAPALSRQGRGQEKGKKEAASQPSPLVGEGGEAKSKPGEGAFLRARAKLNGWSLQHRKGGDYGYDAILDIKQGGGVVGSIERGPANGYDHRAYTFTLDGETIISSASNGNLTAYTFTGTRLGDYIGHDGDVWAVAASSDGRYLVSGAGDQTVRLWNLKTRELLVTLFRGKDGEWVMWTPQGYYTASAGGDALIGWQVNRGPTHEADYYPVSQFRSQYYRPDIVALTIARADEARAITEANKAAERRAAEKIAKQLPPVVTIVDPADGAGFDTDVVRVRYHVRSPSGLPIIRVRALIGGRPVLGAEVVGFDRVRAGGEITGTLRVRVPGRDLTLSVVAETGRNASLPATVALRWTGAAPLTEEDLRKPVLYALVVGVNTFIDKRIPALKWAAVDARDFAGLLARQKGGLYRDVQVRLLTDADAKQRAVIDGLDWLKRSVSQGDVGVLFLAGHGATDARNDYYFIPHDAELDTGAGLFLPRRSTAVPQSEINNALKRLRGHAVFFFDTCHAGNAPGIRIRGQNDLKPFISELRSAESGVIVLASSDGSELSQERDDWKNGAFTYALKEGLAGNADMVGGDGVVSVDELGLYVKERVKYLTNGQQHPVEGRPQVTRNIPFARAGR